MTQYVYYFGDGAAEGRAEMRDLLGGKGANLAEMCHLGLPVPPGMTLTTEVCTYYYDNGQTMPSELEVQVEKALAKIEGCAGARFGDTENPLLVSVRSGARASMPGMMDTVLNLGLNDKTVEGLAARSGNERFAWDSYRRFIQMYADVVLDVDHYHFEELLEEAKRARGITLDTQMTAEDFRALVVRYKERVRQKTGEDFPELPQDQLWGAIRAVLRSWMNQRAITYRKLHNIPQEWGTAVNVQAMVFGNMGEDCATGVAFTRDPSTGEKLFFGEYLINAQGEDVVAGIRTPQSITVQAREASGSDQPAMEETMPEVYRELVEIYQRLEAHYRDMQDIEFTVQGGKLWMLQTRSGKRTAAAAIRIAVEMAEEKLITREEAVRRVDPMALDQLLHPRLDPAAQKEILTRGLPASPGAASGAIVFSADEAEKQAAAGNKVILVRIETSPEDIHGMHAAAGILTARGGMTSHAAVVARGMGKCCVSGAGELRIDYKKQEVAIGAAVLRAGDLLTLNGSTGEVIAGEIPTIQPELSGDFATLMEWADGARTLKIRTNAETPADAATARRFGAEGIGLCRTEHMFFDAERITAMREMIMSDTEKGRRRALDKLLPMQREDFIAIFRVMEGLPVTIRLLDPPLHEFLPHTEAEMQEVATAAGLSLAQVKARTVELKESNPMLGHRGCRLAITYPEIYDMQARAIFEAAAVIDKESGVKITPEIMIPLVMNPQELAILRERVTAIAGAVAKETDRKLDYHIGTMIELPRAALQASSIAAHAEFFSFGTNDLTQTTLGISRDDSGRFIDAYKRHHILTDDPFVTLDQEGVGELIALASTRGRAARAGLKLGICGEHGGDPRSIAFCQKLGLDYVSCSPYRVPVARLAAAQAALNQESLTADPGQLAA